MDKCSAQKEVWMAQDQAKEKQYKNGNHPSQTRKTPDVRADHSSWGYLTGIRYRERLNNLLQEQQKEEEKEEEEEKENDA